MDFVRVWIDASPTTGNKELFRVSNNLLNEDLIRIKAITDQAAARRAWREHL